VIVFSCRASLACLQASVASLRTILVSGELIVVDCHPIHLSRAAIVMDRQPGKMSAPTRNMGRRARHVSRVVIVVDGAAIWMDCREIVVSDRGGRRLLRMVVAAVGVETAAQPIFRTVIGCDDLQDDHPGRPVIADEAEKFFPG
jgi:hypothetical protein